ncbi:MFS general substrate transporter [Hypoxylon crocopeplum]|nr:MFS general substrate transporter [Hypoxylon crocopeplum]
MTGSDERHRRNSNEFTESSPLLPEERPRRPSHRPTLSVTSITSVHVPKVHSGRTIVNLLCVISFIVSCSNGFTVIPETRILEDVVCRKYYGLTESTGVPIDEQLCKENAIQEKVAFIIAIQSSVDAIVGFLAALPWGLAADRIGRKPVFVLNLLGILINISWSMVVLYFHTVFPTELIWLGSAGLLVGGGNAVLTGIILSMTSDATNEEERAVAFMRLHVASLCGTLGSPAVASAMMEKLGPWPPVWAANFVVIIGAIAFLFVPETLKHRHTQDENVPEPEDPEAENVGLKSKASHVIARFKESLSILSSASLILLLLACLGTTPVLYGTYQFMAQFISKRYHIKLSQTGYVQTIYGVAQVVQALIVLPWIARYVMKSTTPARLRASDEHHRDLSIARWSLGFLVLGIFVLGISPTLAGFIFGLILMAIGSCFSSLIRSLLSLYVDPEHRSRLFSMVGMVEVIGSIYAQPFLAGLFALGMNLGDGWIGLPYFGLSILVTVTGSLLFFVRVPKEVNPSPDHENGRPQE